MVVSYEFFGIALTSKYKRQTCANVSQEIVYMFLVHLNQNLFTRNTAAVLRCD